VTIDGVREARAVAVDGLGDVVDAVVDRGDRLHVPRQGRVSRPSRESIAGSPGGAFGQRGRERAEVASMVSVTDWRGSQGDSSVSCGIDRVIQRLEAAVAASDLVASELSKLESLVSSEASRLVTRLPSVVSNCSKALVERGGDLAAIVLTR